VAILPDKRCERLLCLRRDGLFAITNDDPAGTPVYGEWMLFFVADLTSRGDEIQDQAAKRQHHQ
jgi:hypothetical protein